MERLSQQYEGSLRHSETRQRQAIDLLETKMIELRSGKQELATALRNILATGFYSLPIHCATVIREKN